MKQLVEGDGALPGCRAFFESQGAVDACRCCEGAQQMLGALPKLWPPEQTTGPDEGLQAIPICGPESGEPVRFYPTAVLAMLAPRVESKLQ